VAWRTATGEGDAELFERSRGAEATPWPSETNRRSDARMKEGRRRGTAMANATTNLWVSSKVTDRLTKVSPVLKDLKRP
jgi:hypothetical protein